MKQVIAAAPPPSVQDERKREEPARERGFARQIDCTPDTARAPKRGRAGRASAGRPGVPPAGVDERRAGRR